MESAKFYREMYEKMGGLTPLMFDCGRLCGKACCEVTPALPGMYLFPGEEDLYRGVPGFSLSTRDLPGYGPVQLLSCDGACDRALRPLECRVFPLVPKVAGDAVKCRVDARGRSVCPLCHQGKGGLSGAFVQAVQGVFDALWRQPETKRFLIALSNAVDEYEKPLF